MLAPCCLFVGVILAWTVTALSALMSARTARARIAVEDILTIGFIACLLIVVAHVAPDPVAMTLSIATAAHALLLAGVVAADCLHGRRVGRARRARLR